MRKVKTEYYKIGKMGTHQYYIIQKYFDDKCYDRENEDGSPRNYGGIIRNVYYRYQMYDSRFNKIKPNGAYKVSGDLHQIDYNAITTSGDLKPVTDRIELARLMLADS
jgi:hypothetical protein